MQLLTGAAPTPYVLRKYIEAHDVSVELHSRDGFDAWLSRRAALGPGWARTSDAYARHFAPYCALRKKLVLALAITEVSPVSGAPGTTEEATPFVLTVLRLGLYGVAGLFAALAGVVMFGPIHLAFRTRESRV